MSNKDAIVSIRLPYELDQRLLEAAVRLDLSKNDIARHAIRAAVNAIEANGFLVSIPLEMSVRHSTLVSSPSSSFSGYSLNEEASIPSKDFSNRKPRDSRARVALRKRLEKEGKLGKKSFKQA